MVILDPIRFFVCPATVVICKHIPTETDPTLQRLPVHKKCLKMKHMKWKKMTDTGVVDGDLLEMMLEDHSENFNQIRRLMIKFGLLVRLKSERSDTEEYLVPALLRPSMDSAEWSDSQWHTCYLVFTTSKELDQSATLLATDLRLFGFLPLGLFERLVGKAVVWAQNTSIHQSHTNFLLTQNEAILFFGSKRFRMKVHLDMSIIEVNIEGKYPRTVHKRLMEQVQCIISECLKSLHCFTALRYPYSVCDSSSPPFQLTDDSFLIPLDQIKSVVASHSALSSRVGRRLLSDSEVLIMYQDWLPHYKQQQHYDIFLR